MAYVKQTWNNDDPATPLSASRLNHMEDGIETANAEDAGVNVLQLETGAPIPTDPVPVSGTFVVRTDPPPVPLDLVAASATSYGSTSSNSWAVPYPAGIVVGDLLVACIVTNSQTANITPPAGWTLLQRQTPISSDFRSGGIYGYAVTGTPPTGNAVFTSGETVRVTASMFRVTGADLTTPVLVNGGTGSRVTTVYTVPTLTGSGGGLIISLTQGNATAGNNADPLAYSNDLTQVIFTSSAADLGITRTWLNVRYKITATDLATHTVTSPASNSSMGSEVLAIRGAA